MVQERQLLLITILKIPVKIIKWGSHMFSMLTYLPNYFIILIIDYILFHPSLDQSLIQYSLAWLPRVILLQVPPLLFWFEFYLGYKVLQLQNIESITMQIGAMSLIIIGALALMRKGYLSFIKNYNPTKLKSPLEHLALYKIYILDLFGIVVAILNSLLIVNIGKTFAYNYSPIDRRFIKHICYTFNSSVLFHIKFYYVHIFFRIFKWRYNHDQHNIKKQQQNRNAFNLFVLLSLLHLLTWLDIIAVLLLGWLPLMHIQYSSLFRNNLKQDYRLWRVVLKYDSLVLIQILQLALLVLGIFKPRGAKAVLLKIIRATKFEEQKKIFGQLFEVIGLSLLQVPYFCCFLIVLCSIYKFKKRNKLLSAIEDPLKKSLSKEKITLKCLGELLSESIYFLPILFATIAKPYNYFWLAMTINHETLNVNSQIVSNYALRCFYDIFWVPATIFIVSINILYSPIASWQRIKIFRTYRNTLTREQVIIRDSNASHWKPVFNTFKLKITKDLLHLPFYLYSLISGLWMIGGISEPQQCPRKFESLMTIFYLKWVQLRRKERFQYYLQCLKADQASGVLKNDPIFTMRFWKFCSKCQRYRTLIKIFKFILPSRSVKKIEQRQKLVTQFSRISNQYWNSYNLFWALVGLTIYLIINTIVTIFGVVVLFPLTMWRIPTFIIIYAKHNNRMMFFKIVFSIYRQQLFDIIQLPKNIIGFLVSPYHYIIFRWKNKFYYGQEGINTFQKAQRIKQRILTSIIYESFKNHIMIFECIFVACLLIRLQNLRQTIRQDLKLKFHSLIIFYFQLKFPTVKQVLPNQALPEASKFQKKLAEYQQKMHLVFFLALSDIPYLFVLLIITLLMPWRIFYVTQVVKSFMQGDSTRKKFKTLLKNCLSDYICIILNIALIFTIVKAKKSLQLIFKNYRLNFFVGFLDYSYMHELFKQLKQGLYFYHNAFFLILAMIFDWPNAFTIFSKVYQIYKDRKEKQKKQLMELQMKQKLVKENKTNLLSMMGFNSFAVMTQFLHPIQIAKLSEVNKMAYCIIKESDVWQLQWERLYQQKYKNVIKGSDNYKQMVIQACKLEKRVPIHKKIETYQEIILSALYQSFRGNQIDFKQLSKKVFSQQKWDSIFNVQSYRIEQGLIRAQVELNQQQRNQRQIRRLLNEPEPQQFQRPQLQDLDEFEAYAYWFLFRPVQWLAQWPNRLFIVDSHRRKKQILYLLIPILIVYTYIRFWWNNFFQVFRATSFISVKIMLLVYFHLFAYVLIIRFFYLYRNWIALKPFDLKQDFINFCRYVKRKVIETKNSFKIWFKEKIIIPVRNAYIRIKNYLYDKYIRVKNYLYGKYVIIKNYLYEKYTRGKAFFINRVYTPAANKFNQIVDFFKRIIILISKKIWHAIKWIWNKIVRFAVYFFNNVALPLYLVIVDKLKKLWQLCKQIARLFSIMIKKILSLIKSIFRGIYQFIIAFLRNLNTLYRNILGGLMSFFLKFGILGELVFTLLGLFIMSMPILFCVLFYTQKWAIVCSSIWTMTLIVSGYKHLNELKNTINRK